MMKSSMTWSITAGKFPQKESVKWRFDVLFVVSMKTVKQAIECPEVWETMMSMWRHCSMIMPHRIWKQFYCVLLSMCPFLWRSWPWFNIKMSSYQHSKSHCGDKTVVRSSYLHKGISYTGKMSSLYWIRAHMSKFPCYFLIIPCGDRILLFFRLQFRPGVAHKKQFSWYLIEDYLIWQK